MDTDNHYILLHNRDSVYNGSFRTIAFHASHFPFDKMFEVAGRQNSK